LLHADRGKEKQQKMEDMMRGVNSLKKRRTGSLLSYLMFWEGIFIIFFMADARTVTAAGQSDFDVPAFTAPAQEDIWENNRGMISLGKEISLGQAISHTGDGRFPFSQP
jgi:hypothetical protein